MAIFEYVIVTKLTPKQKGEGHLEALIDGPVTIPAHDKKAAELKAVRSYENFDADEMEVIVRPFVE